MQEDKSTPIKTEVCLQLRYQNGRSTRSSRSSQLLAPAAWRRLAPLNSNCFVCGEQNPNGLQLTFKDGSTGVYATWVPNKACESFQGTVHGGIITTVLDEAMSKAIIARGWEAFTVELNVRFRGRISPGETLHVHGWITEKHKRRILTEATLFANTGTERAHAWATFLVPRAEEGS